MVHTALDAICWTFQYGFTNGLNDKQKRRITWGRNTPKIFKVWSQQSKRALGHLFPRGCHTNHRYFMRDLCVTGITQHTMCNSRKLIFTLPPTRWSTLCNQLAYPWQLINWVCNTTPPVPEKSWCYLTKAAAANYRRVKNKGVPTLEALNPNSCSSPSEPCQYSPAPATLSPDNLLALSDHRGALPASLLWDAVHQQHSSDY